MPSEPVPSVPRAATLNREPDLSRRAAPAQLPEWMDEPGSYEDFRACLRDLAQVNRLSLAYRPTLRFLERLAPALPAGRPLRIVDVGSGGGDMLRRIAGWAARRGTPVHLTGIDLNPFAARAAQEFTAACTPIEAPVSQIGPAAPIEWVTGDAFSYAPAQGIDVVLSSLFTHHLEDPEIVRFVTWMESVTSLGWFINDLCRESTPLHLFGLVARVARWHRFVQHDGPVSFRRSFREQDWQRLLSAAGVPRAAQRMARWFPARLCVERLK